LREVTLHCTERLPDEPPPPESTKGETRSFDASIASVCSRVLADESLGEERNLFESLAARAQLLDQMRPVSVVLARLEDDAPESPAPPVEESLRAFDQADAPRAEKEASPELHPVPLVDLRAPKLLLRLGELRKRRRSEVQAQAAEEVRRVPPLKIRLNRPGQPPPPPDKLSTAGLESSDESSASEDDRVDLQLHMRRFMAVARRVHLPPF